ncbi:MAG: hypothetical protein DMD58_08090 [Gemmatimonadetes bacterium]|nr:MAG: hypothetical protein DMD58_08090 [Gemmatimonadota bacterium]
MMRRFSLLLIPLVIATALSAQTVRYEVSVAHGEFHVAAEFPTNGKDTLFVSLPAWSPGNYEIQNYARYLHGFVAKNSSGQLLYWDRADKDTWRVATGRSDRVTVEFDYSSDTIDLSIARTAQDFAQFLGTNLFMFEEGQLARPAEVRFRLPAGWQVTTALKGPTSGVYRAGDYHELADAMTFVGRYSLDSLQADGKWIRIAVWPAADYTAAVARNLRNGVAKMAPVQSRIMGEAPYDVYTVFFNVIHGPIDFGGGLEHSSSQYDIMPALGFADPFGNLGDFMYPLLSHEFFHLWNVKRIRPAEMWPYDYHAEQYTPPPEPWSVEDGSEATWIHEVYVNSSQLYYPKGSLLGFLLDISIRDATDNAHNLDQVMRALYTRYYRQSKGFLTADLLNELRTAGMPDVDAFYRRYIDGRDSLPYETIFAKAGLVFHRQVVTSPFVGISANPTPSGMVVQQVTPKSSAEAAGVQPGDVLTNVGGIPVTVDQDWGGAFRTRFRGKAGQPLTILVQRDGRALTLTSTVQEHATSTVSLERAAHPTPKQAKIWQGLASGL